MSSSFRIDPSDARPIWRQIEENVRNLVASGTLRPAASVPSVRDLARSLAVNPATVAKAYQRLTDAGVLAVRRGDGTYVATAPPPISVEQRRDRLRAEALRYASLAATLGASPQESAAALAAAWSALVPPAGPAPADGAGAGAPAGHVAGAEEEAPGEDAPGEDTPGKQPRPGGAA
jgi:GntR family transcriptional regulator